jgi:hypothetical protein
MKMELWIAILSGCVAIGGATIAYVAQTKVVYLQNEFQQAHETQLAQQLWGTDLGQLQNLRKTN